MFQSRSSYTSMRFSASYVKDAVSLSQQNLLHRPLDSQVGCSSSVYTMPYRSAKRISSRWIFSIFVCTVLERGTCDFVSNGLQKKKKRQLICMGFQWTVICKDAETRRFLSCLPYLKARLKLSTLRWKCFFLTLSPWKYHESQAVSLLVLSEDWFKLTTAVWNLIKERTHRWIAS